MSVFALVVARNARRRQMPRPGVSELVIAAPEVEEVIEAPVAEETFEWPLEHVLPARRSAAHSRLAAWALAHARDLVTGLALTAGIGVVHAWGMARSPAFFDDEGTYVSQAYAVDKLHLLSPYTYWYDHPPLGWLLLALWAKIVPVFGPSSFSIAGARVFILVLMLVSTALLYAIARRLGIRWSLAAFATLLYGLSPLALHYQRMVLLDNIGVTWLLAAFLLALTPRRRLGAYAMAGICLAAACLTKETFLLFAPAIFVLIWQGSAGPTRRFAVAVFTTVFVFTCAFYPLFAVLRGELFEGAHHTSLMYGIRFQLDRQGGGSILDASSGARGIIRSWLDIDPVLLAFGVPLIPMLLWVRRFRALGLALAIPVFAVLRPGGYVPAMFVIGILPFAALGISAVAEEFYYLGSAACRYFEPKRRAAALIIATTLVLAPTALAAPTWVSRDATQLSTNNVSATERAVDWLSLHASRKSTLLVDDTVWTDLVERGFQRNRTIWFYKLDLDPAVRRPWWRFDYVVRSNLVADNLHWLPRSRQVMAHTKLVVAYTTSTERIEIRRVIKPSGR